jgi:alanine racemase
MCIDVGNVPRDRVRVGDFVELVGATIGVDEVADAAGTISYEILARLGARLHREYVEDGT